MSGWTCEVCTFLNDDALPSCEMCEASRPATPSSAAQQQPSLLPPRRVAQAVAQWPDDDKAEREPFVVDDDDDGSGHPFARDADFWHCTLCTFLNSNGRSQCEMCQSARPGTSPASPSASGGGAASAHGWPDDTDDIDEASDDHNVHDSAEVAAFRQRFNGWKTRSEGSGKEWDLSLTDVFAFKSRHEVHLLLTETYHVDPATSPSSSTSSAAQPEREKKDKGKGKKGGGPLSLLSRGRGGKAKEDHGDEGDEGDDNDDTDNAPILGSADDEVKKQSSSSCSKTDKRSNNNKKDKSPGRGRGLLGLGGRGGGGDGAKPKKVERHIDLILQMPARGNTDSVYFLERVKRDKDDLATIRPGQELRASEAGGRGIKVSDWINDVNEFLIEHSMQDEAPPLGYHHHQPLYLPTQVQALTLESILSRMMQLFDARKQKLKDAKAHFEKVMRDQELLKRFDDDYFGKREAYYHKASTVEPSGMKAHLEAYGITQEVKAMHGICGKKSLRLSKDTGQVAIMVRLSDVMDDSLAASLGIEVLQPIILSLDFGRLPAAEKASDVQKHILAVKRGHKFPLPYLVVKQSQGEGDREGEEISNNRIASFYFKSIAMKYLRETWGANTRRKHFRHIRSWFSKNDDDVGSTNKAKAKGDEEEEGDEELDGDHEEEDMWVCGACTYLNVHGRQKCEICETPAQQHELGKDRLAEKKSRNTASASFMGQCSAKFLGGNFFVGLLAYLRKGMADHRLYCLICHRKHACASETPLVCCAERCVHYYEAMQMGQSFATTVVCPYTSCKAQDKIDREEAVVATFAMSDLEGQEMDRQAAELLLNMYRHQFLPNSDVKKFFFNGFKSWWGLGGTIKVTSVTNVMRPELVARFMRKRQSLSAKKIRVGYHGTSEEALPSILQKGLLVPGRGNDVGHKSDTGWWGGGIYLSPDPMVSSSYAWNSKLIVCAALLGRPYHCKQRMDGQACQKGYDSHISPWWSLSGNLGKEWVLFDEGQVMPCYVISFHKQ